MASESRGIPRWWQEFQRLVSQAELAIRQGQVLDSLVAATAKLPVLIVVTHRPEFTSPWRGHGHLTELRLNNLRQSDCMNIIARLCGHRALPVEVNREILARTDGVPLFVEELTKTVLASGMLAVQGEEYVRVSPASDIAIPSTLNDSLTARLDGLAGARKPTIKCPPSTTGLPKASTLQTYKGRKRYCSSCHK